VNEFCCRLKTDTYFGSFHGVRGYNDPNILIQRNGSSYLFQPAAGTNFILPFHVTNSCNYNAYGFTPAPICRIITPWPTPTRFVTPNSVRFPAPTFPNRVFLFSGMNDPNGTGGGPVVDNSHVPTNGYSWTTYAERLQTAGVSWRGYRPVGDWFGELCNGSRNIKTPRPAIRFMIAAWPR
jgi:phospholipase C